MSLFHVFNGELLADTELAVFQVDRERPGRDGSEDELGLWAEDLVTFYVPTTTMTKDRWERLERELLDALEETGSEAVGTLLDFVTEHVLDARKVTDPPTLVLSVGEQLDLTEEVAAAGLPWTAGGALATVGTAYTMLQPWLTDDDVLRIKFEDELPDLD